jgi:hypothetical protein
MLSGGTLERPVEGGEDAALGKIKAADKGSVTRINVG